MHGRSLLIHVHCTPIGFCLNVYTSSSASSPQFVYKSALPDDLHCHWHDFRGISTFFFWHYKRMNESLRIFTCFFFALNSDDLPLVQFFSRIYERRPNRPERPTLCDSSFRVFSCCCGVNDSGIIILYATLFSG